MNVLFFIIEKWRNGFSDNLISGVLLCLLCNCLCTQIKIYKIHKDDNINKVKII